MKYISRKQGKKQNFLQTNFLHYATKYFLKIDSMNRQNSGLINC